MARRIDFRVPKAERVTRCPSCGGRIVFAYTKSGARMPLSMATVVKRRDGRYAESHFADCPGARLHRKNPRTPRRILRSRASSPGLFD